jgi:hypothetical protein
VSCSGAAARRFAAGGVNAAALVDVQSNGSSARVSSLSIEPASGHLLLAGAADGPVTLSARRPAPLGNASAAAPPLSSRLSAGAAGRSGAFVARADADGSPLWACVLHGNGSNDDPGFTVTSVAADAPGGGGVYVAGVFSPGASAAGAALACARAGAPAQSYAAPVGPGAAGAPPLSRTNRTSLVPPLVLSGHAASLRSGRGRGFPLAAWGSGRRAGVAERPARGSRPRNGAPAPSPSPPPTLAPTRVPTVYSLPPSLPRAKKADTQRPATCLACAFSASRPHARGTAGRRG